MGNHPSDSYNILDLCIPMGKETLHMELGLASCCTVRSRSSRRGSSSTAGFVQGQEGG